MGTQLIGVIELVAHSKFTIPWKQIKNTEKLEKNKRL